MVAEAIDQWAATGLTAEQVALLQAVSVQVADLSPQPYLGVTTPEGILIDDDGAGQGWKYEAERTKDEAESTKSFDLLTVVLHEMGHVLGLDDLDSQAHADDLMAGSLMPGEQRSVAVSGGVLPDVALSLRDTKPIPALNPGATQPREAGVPGTFAGLARHVGPHRASEDWLVDLITPRDVSERWVDALFAEW